MIRRLSLACILALICNGITSARLPNVVLIVADDLGIADVGMKVNGVSVTPRLDRMAEEGRRFTSFYVSQAVCTASRASLMTGCYANRVGLQGALNHTSTNGIHPDEHLMPEMFKELGYATAAYGKWHLGTVLGLHAMRHGFDEFFGIPYSNDNSKYHPSVPDMPPLPLYDGLEVVESDPDQALFTKRTTEKALGFIAKNKQKPFFLYLPHVMPHVPVFASEDFQGATGGGLYADVIRELDDGVGQVLDALSNLGLAKDTLVIFTSDNGPFLSYGDRAGSALPFREGKLTTFEGGVRVPCIMWWPGRIPAASVCDEPMMTIDLLPSLVGLVNGRAPEKKIDGLGALPLIFGEEGAKSPHEALFFYAGTELQAVRSGKWKLHFAHRYLTVNGPPGKDGKPANFENMKPERIEKSGLDGIASRHGYKVEQLPLSLFDLEADPAESINVAEQFPEVVERLSQLAVPVRAALGDSITGVSGTEIRAAGDVN
jgi:arylsulfatase A-like enzyme